MDASISKFGWKAQTRALRDFSADAFINEMGVTSNTFTNESDPSAACNFHAGLEDTPVNTPNVVVDQWNLLTETQKQDLLNFLRSL